MSVENKGWIIISRQNFPQDSPSGYTESKFESSYKVKVINHFDCYLIYDFTVLFDVVSAVFEASS